VPGTLGHLTSRFFEVLTASPLQAAEADDVRSWLSPGQSWLFFSQEGPDQRHGFEAAGVARSRGLDAIGVRAALLHDVGKRHARLGVLGRTFASLAIKARLPLTTRWRLYRDHGELGARELRVVGSEPLVVDFARYHHDSRPPGVPQDTWEVLQSADEPAKTRRSARSE
jgi:putative nucleotidyltransferase with HDIG domain